MYIYKFIHIDSGRSYIGQTIQDPNHQIKVQNKL